MIVTFEEVDFAVPAPNEHRIDVIGNTREFLADALGITGDWRAILGVPIYQAALEEVDPLVDVRGPGPSPLRVVVLIPEDLVHRQSRVDVARKPWPVVGDLPRITGRDAVVVDHHVVVVTEHVRREGALQIDRGVDTSVVAGPQGGVDWGHRGGGGTGGRRGGIGA